LDADRLRKLIHAGRSLVSEHDLERVFDRVLRAARELTGARRATIREQASNGKRARGRVLDVPIVVGDKTSLTLHLADKRDGVFAGGRLEIISSEHGTAVLASVPTMHAKAA
jgi:hypothetical protein